MNTVMNPSLTEAKRALIAQCLEQNDLPIRGWFNSTISQFLPFFDVYLPSTLSPLLSPKYYYDRARVLKIEQESAFQEHQNAILADAAIHLLQVGTAHQQLMDRVLEIELDLTLLPQKELDLRVNTELNLRVPVASASTFDERLGDTLVPILAVQEQMAEFESQLWQLEPYFFHPSYHQAKELLTHKFLDAIYREHPELLIGCQHYAAQRCYNFNRNGWDAVD